MRQLYILLVAISSLVGCSNLLELKAPNASVTAVRPVAGKGL